MFSWINSNSVKYVPALTAVGRSELLARWPGTHSRVLSGIQRAAQTVLGVYLKRTCSRETGASGAFPTPFDPGELYHDSYTCKISILKVQKLQRKETNGRTRPIASLSPITRSVITQCFLTRPMALMRPHAKLLWRFVLYFACMFDLCQCHYMHLSNSMYIIPTFPYLGSGITEDGECIYTAEFRTRLEGRRSGHHCRKYGKVIAYRFR